MSWFTRPLEECMCSLYNWIMYPLNYVKGYVCCKTHNWGTYATTHRNTRHIPFDYVSKAFHSHIYINVLARGEMTGVKLLSINFTLENDIGLTQIVQIRFHWCSNNNSAIEIGFCCVMGAVSGSKSFGKQKQDQWRRIIVY